MAWVVVPGSGGVWEYDNAATAADTYINANGITTAGVRTFIPSNGGPSQLIYVKTRKVGETVERGELSKTFYDARAGEIPFIPSQQLQTLFGNNSGILVIPERQYLFTDSLGTVPVENPGDPVLSVREQSPQNLLLSVVGGTYGVDEDREFILLDGTGFIGAPPTLENTNEIFFATAMRKTATIASHSTRYTRFTRWVESDSQGLYYDRNNLRLYLKAVRTGGTDVRPEAFFGTSGDTVVPVGTDWILSSEVSNTFSTIRISEFIDATASNTGTALTNQSTDNNEFFQQIPGRIYGMIMLDRNLNYVDREILYDSFNSLMSTSRKNWPTIVAHRGFADCITENSMDAFNTAIVGGIEWLECDVQASSDGTAFLFHDGTVDSRTDGTGNFSDLTDSYIDTIRYDYDASNRQIARFADLLDLMLENPNTRLMAEIKDKGNIGDPFIDTFMGLITARNLQNRVVVCSFNLTDLQYIRANYPSSIKLGFVSDTGTNTDVDTARTLTNTILLANRSAVTGVNNSVVAYAHNTTGGLEYIEIAAYTIDSQAQLSGVADSNCDYAISDQPHRYSTGGFCFPVSPWVA